MDSNYKEFEGAFRPLTVPEVLQEETKESVLQEAQRIVSGARQEAYGHPLDNFGQTAKMWSAVLGMEVSAEQVALCMILVKISRQTHKPQRDNVVDMAGYAATLSMIVEEREKREGTDVQ